MRRRLTAFQPISIGACVSVVIFMTVGGTFAGAVVTGPPEWAYPLNPNGKPKQPADDGVPRRVPGSAVTMALSATTSLYNTPDWHPDQHPPMPEVVAHGRRPDVMACGVCHLANGQGRPENASLAGLPGDYIIRQIAAFRDGSRRTAQPAMLSPGGMIVSAEHASSAESAAAAAYFSTLPYKPWVKVIETGMVPRLAVAGVSALAAVPGGGLEPIGDRIVEVPDDADLTTLRDDASGFVAYVPYGSIDKGGVLVRSGAGARLPCGTCHGADLRGTATVPALAGRSPSYMFRQLYDIRTGSRSDQGAQPMKAEVASLTDEDMLNIAAYVAKQHP